MNNILGKRNSIVSIPLFIICFIIVIYLMVGCGKGLNKEATKVAFDKVLNKHTVQCGNYWYIYYRLVGLCRFDKVQFSIKPDKLNEADKRNGIEWKGSIGLRGGDMVQWVESDRWSEWKTNMIAELLRPAIFDPNSPMI